MAAGVGVTHMKYLQFYLDNSSGALTDLSAYLNVPGTFGLKYEEIDVTALSNAIKSIVKGWPESPLKLQFIPHQTLFQFFTPLIAPSWNTPLAFDFRIGVNQVWAAGDPTFGLTGTSANGIIPTAFQFDGSNPTVDLNMFAGSAAPAWGTAANT